MKNLSNPQMRAVLEAAAKSFGWPRKKNAGRTRVRNRLW